MKIALVITVCGMMGCMQPLSHNDWTFEKEEQCMYKGYYHIWGVTLSSTENNITDNLLIPSLIERVKKDSINEGILATSATREGQTTAHYIQGSLKNTSV